MSYIVAGCKPWNRKIFDETINKFSGRWHYIGLQEELSLPLLKQVKPWYLFFLNWSWKVPDEIVNAHECICFHPTDLPYGRGGTPIQNLILRGHTQTMVSAFRMTSQMDAGPVYLRKPMSLEGEAEEIYLRFSRLAATMIKEIIQKKPKPVFQTGEVVRFKRRTPQESEIPLLESLQALFDFIRMLDAKDFPKAFLSSHRFRFEFSDASFSEGAVTAKVVITPLKKT